EAMIAPDPAEESCPGDGGKVEGEPGVLQFENSPPDRESGAAFEHGGGLGGRGRGRSDEKNERAAVFVNKIDSPELRAAAIVDHDEERVERFRRRCFDGVSLPEKAESGDIFRDDLGNLGPIEKNLNDAGSGGVELSA